LFIEKATIDPIAWRKKYAYTIDIILPTDQSANLSDEILRLLNTSTDYEGIVEKRKVPCLVLTRIDNIDRIATRSPEPSRQVVNGKLEFKMATTSGFTGFLENRKDVKEYVIDETGYDGKVDLAITESGDLSAWRSDLQKCGLDLVPEERELLVFVLRSKKIYPINNKIAVKRANENVVND
jgi:hypothetical protein